VRSGETLWSIARAYDIKIQELAEANNITDPKLIGQNSIIFIPEANQVIDDVITTLHASQPQTNETEERLLSRRIVWCHSQLFTRAEYFVKSASSAKHLTPEIAA